MPEPPHLGGIVHYKSKTRGYELPAIITATTRTLDPMGVEMGDVVALDTHDEVHLHVFTCGDKESYPEYKIPHGQDLGNWHFHYECTIQD